MSQLWGITTTVVTAIIAIGVIILLTTKPNDDYLQLGVVLELMKHDTVAPCRTRDNVEPERKPFISSRKWY